MSVGLADLATGVVALWGTAGLNAVFTAFWTAAEIAAYPVLNDKVATPGQPFPYCVFGGVMSNTSARMSAGRLSIREIRDVLWQFDVYAQPEGALSAKQVAAVIVEEIMKVFGGHPDTAPQAVELAHGECLIATYIQELQIRTDDQIYQWGVQYRFKLDVPVMA